VAGSATLVAAPLTAVASAVVMSAIALFASLHGYMRSEEFLEKLPDLRCDAARDAIRQIESLRKLKLAVLMRGDDTVEKGACARLASPRLNTRCREDQHRQRAEPAVDQLLFGGLHGSPKNSALLFRLRSDSQTGSTPPMSNRFTQCAATTARKRVVTVVDTKQQPTIARED
jgi:hypothetical protein